MFDKVEIIDSGNTSFYNGEIVNKDNVLKENRRMKAEGKKYCKIQTPCSRCY